MFKIFGTYICWINIQNAILEVSGAVRQLYMTLGVYRLTVPSIYILAQQSPSWPGSPYPRGFWITHNDAPQSLRPLLISDLVAETSTWQHTTLTTEIHAPGGIRTHKLSRRAVADLRLRPRGHWDRPSINYCTVNIMTVFPDGKYEIHLCLFSCLQTRNHRLLTENCTDRLP